MKTHKQQFDVKNLEDVYRLFGEGYNLEDKFPFNHPIKTNNKTINMSLGKIWFNYLLPDDFELVNEPVDKKKLTKLLKELFNRYNTKAPEYITYIQEEAFKLTTLIPSSFYIDGFILPKELIKEKEQFLKKVDSLSIEEFQKEVERLTKKYVDFFKKKKIPIQYVLDGKVKGDPYEQIRNLLVAKGYVVDIEGNVFKKPIVHGIAEGYTKEEYAMAGAEARKNFYLKASMTAVPGYLARKVTTASANVMISEKDCKTKSYFELKVDDKLANTLIGRYYYESGKLKVVETPDDIKGKTIKLRSPLYCKSQNGICEKCYGIAVEKLGTKNIGILAGGAVNSVALNTLMKIRHKASKIDIYDVDFTKDIKKFNIDKDIVNYVDIQPKQIIAKTNINIEVNLNDYNEDNLVETSESLILPGIIDFYVPKDNKFFTFPFNYEVHLKYPSEYEKIRKTINLKYTKGEVIIEQDKFVKELKPNMIDRLFNGSIKYLTTPDMLVLMIVEQLDYGVDLVHLETVVQNMCRDKQDNTIPARLTNYRDFEIIGVKRLPFINSFLSGLIFENINRAILTGLKGNSRKIELNPLEKIVTNQFDLSEKI